MDRTFLAPADLSNFQSVRHLTNLYRGAESDRLDHSSHVSPMLDTMRKRCIALVCRPVSLGRKRNRMKQIEWQTGLADTNNRWSLHE